MTTKDTARQIARLMDKADDYERQANMSRNADNAAFMRDRAADMRRDAERMRGVR